MANSYNRGDTVRLSGTFVASGNIIVEPASVYVLIRTNLGSIGTYGYGAAASSILGSLSVVRAATGCYYLDVVPSANPPGGNWTYRFDSGGKVAPAAAGEQTFNVADTPFL